MTDIISKKEAKQAGLKHYFDGKTVCKRGHLSLRYVTTGGCVACYAVRVPPEFQSWKHARSRCTNPNDPSWHLYGGRPGNPITMCQAWIDSYPKFMIDMGPRPPGTCLERIDNSKGYFPGNCVWATSHRQHRNMRSNVIIDTGGGRKVCMTDAARGIGIKDRTIRVRAIRQRISSQAAWEHYRDNGLCPKGLFRAHRIVLDGDIVSLSGAARRLGFHRATIREMALKRHGGNLQAAVDALAASAAAD